ncbi:MAG: prepilin-type N-terminal cleavage/methylation domain-containing protein [Bacteroidales bacterium]|nr:prepilin-type N-terminal cleavage/methylation domain-containing protein [Bacteroidales bacterium]
MTRNAQSRAGFTLLEVLLASAIAVLLLGSLYFALDLTLGQTQVGRESVAADNLARGIFQRMTRDLTMSLGPLPPKSGGNAAGVIPTDSGDSTGSAIGTTTGTISSTTGAVSTTTGTISSSTGTDTTTNSPGAEALAADVPFQAGVIGSESQLTVFLSRVPDSLANLNPSYDQADLDVQSPSGLRRVTYWLAAGGTGGLCRQVRVWVTADGVRDSVDPDLTSEASDRIAESVVSLMFEYFDGSTWATSWDGSAVGPDGVTPTGPPRAIRVTLGIAVPERGGGTRNRMAVHVFPVRAAPGLSVQEFVDLNATSSDSSSTTTTGGTTP